ncbi:hypothetical protein [Chryseobacterium sp. SC28]|uniref:hypothetical protein n=1 Tax=Chryseobacterium sp. SC28 TaxID=2268028 RepID=UPI000F64561A|nr:hypothetical protein [Chryseobacterium sp. SC28]RRQ45504.1 hypothetical protein DTW91_10065 [Chryseobacterium sp. SC28]
MKIFKYISILLILLSISCCVNQKEKDEEQINTTVQKFWITVQNNDEENYLKLIEGSEEYRFAMLYQLHYLNRNYSKIKAITESKEIQIKDTNELGGSQKCVEYLFVKPNSTTEPLSVRLFFLKSLGYNKIFNVQIIGNMPKWEKKEL